MRRASPSGEIWERVRSFTSSRGRFTVVVVRNTEGHIYNVSEERFMSWPEVDA